MPPDPLLERLRTALAERYDVLRLVGAGGMARVYQARELRHDRSVAIKVLSPELQTGVNPKRFLAEIRTAANLQHPHILPLFDSGEADGLLYYTMPLVEGVTLKDRLESGGPLELAEFLSILSDVADGLGYAHRQGLVHRDVKPSNILLSGGNALLADFGLARAIEVPPEGGLTRTGVLLGTGLYMSPEQGSGETEIDQRADLYSLGCVCYQMLTGKPPYQRSHDLAVLAAHITSEVPSVTDERTDVPEGVGRAITKAMAKAPNDRFASVEAFLAAVTHASGADIASLHGRVGPPSFGWRRKRIGQAATALAAIALAWIAASSLSDILPATVDEGSSVPRLVVLPFDHLGGPEFGFLTAGITEELTGRLASLGQLSVIGRLSALQYDKTEKPLDQIADELDVDYVVDGSVQWSGDAAGPTLRARPSLIRVSDGEQVWFETYDFRVADVFEMQSTIVERMVDALSIVLEEAQQLRLRAQPTDDVEAYQLYLRGNDSYGRSWAPTDVETALSFYQRAADRDPGFALALARLAQAHVFMFYRRFDRSEGRLAAARLAKDSALALDPALPDAHVAQGAYSFLIEQDYGAALMHFERAIALNPSDTQPLEFIADVRRRQGEFDDAIEAYERIANIDPRNAAVWLSLGDTRLFVRQFDAAEPAIDRAISLQPAFSDAYVYKVRVILGRNGDVERARAVFEAAVDEIGTVRWRSSLQRLLVALYDGEEVLARLRPGEWGLTSATRYDLAMGEVLQSLGAADSARVHWESARAALEAAEAVDPSQPFVPSFLGITYAALGMDEEAVAAARRALQLLPVERDALEAPAYLVNLAQVQMMVDHHDEAVETLEAALAIPSWLNQGVLRTDPVWDPLREHPGFQALLSASDAVGG